jgi:ribosome biogenesis protein ENP2
MHGYFLALKLYETARIIANPFAYDEHREKMIREKMEKMAESRIRTKKDAGVKVNKALAEKLLRDEEKAKKRARHKENTAKTDGMDIDVEIGEDEEKSSKPKLLQDPRFAKVFQDPAFAIDENSREFAMLNPSTVAQKRERVITGSDDAEDSDTSSYDHASNSESEHTDSKESDDTSESSADGISLLSHLLPNF